MSTSLSGIQVRIEAATSPSGTAKTRTPIACISAITSSWRGFARVITTRVSSGLFRAFATFSRFSFNGFSKSITPFAPGPTTSFSMYISGALRKLPFSPAASTASAFDCPIAVMRVPSIGSTAISTSSPPIPTCSPMYSIGASSISPSPMTISPLISVLFSRVRITSTAAPSAAFLSPRPSHL
ncbi:hypothetical protein VEx25_0188 [Vibrio antiquarius]|uniref:Uncharacterized protein n=1 Tax=Vibrio antiquarius (strain Ex25) TaxID=150340 RepID=A0ABM9WU45_VIBAE|nr:hypothetical protein VEx25_0188 [Vibrio antiquarius]